MKKSKHKPRYEPEHTPEQTPDKKPGKIFLIFAGLCVAALPFIVFAAITYESPEIIAAETHTPLIEPQSLDFDHKGKLQAVSCAGSPSGTFSTGVHILTG